MKNKKVKKLLLGLLLFTALAIPASVYAYSVMTQYFGGYSLGFGDQQYLQFTVSDSRLIYQNGNLTVTKIMADSGSSTCTWCELKLTLKKKSLLGIYTTIDSNNVNTTSTGYYYVSNYDNVGTGIFRYYVKNTNHYLNTGTIRINAQDTKY